MENKVSEIHKYPLRPAGYTEPLFHSRESRKEILEHFVKGGWLWRASEAPEAPEAPEVTEVCSGSDPVRASPGRCGSKLADARVSQVLASWREVDRWWEPDGGVDVVWRLVQSERGRQEILAYG